MLTNFSGRMGRALAFPVIPFFVVVPFLLAADGGCSGGQVIGGNNSPDGGTAPAIENPTGSCDAPSESGDIACYSVSEPGTTWMVDCEHPVDRHYWRVYVPPVEPGTRNAFTAFMLPRPDGSITVSEICDGDDTEVIALFDEYGLCKAAFGPSDVERINMMLLSDALAISHALHENLRFRPVEVDGAWDIAPFALPEDLEDACSMTGNADVSAKCDDYLAAVCGPTNIGVLLSLTEAEAQDLADALNALYGIPN